MARQRSRIILWDARGPAGDSDTTTQLSTGLPALVDAADGCIRRVRKRPARAVLRDAEQNAGCEMRNAKCEESRGFRKGRKKGRAGPRPGSTECRYRYRHGHHSGLLRPAKAWGNFGVPAGLAPICAGACWSQPATSEKGPGNCR